MTGTILLKNGTLLLHNPSGNVAPTVSDLLITGNTISSIAALIEPPSSSTLVIDCTDKIISPGLIDTHRHMWHTQMKGHENSQLFDFLFACNFTGGPLYNPEDVFWGELAGCMEALRSGTTTVVDHSHINHSDKHAPNAISATLTSGIRSVYCYCPNPRVTSWSPYTVEMNPAPWFIPQLQAISQLPATVRHSRVMPGLAFDGNMAPREIVEQTYQAARAMKLQLITTHCTGGWVEGGFEPIATLASYGLLADDILFSHANNMTPTEQKLLTSVGGFVSSTPTTELQAAMGPPVATRPDLLAAGRTSLGVDCHCITAGDLLTEMRTLLQYHRAVTDAPTTASQRLPRKVALSTEAVFNMATVAGARAIGMAGKLGVLAEGALADIVVFDGASPALVAARDPVAAVVSHASPADVEIVIVDGTVRKMDSKLLGVVVENAQGLEGALGTGTKLTWGLVAKELVVSQKRIVSEIDKVDASEVRRVLLAAFGLKEEVFV
ncbi:hypothetical protein EDC01DRAFT_339479 [Geopyxis carbonaria]|nr:hypothetical protein EDC01DRAFT_339479 [Geopyxis carbonaria]